MEIGTIAELAITPLVFISWLTYLAPRNVSSSLTLLQATIFSLFQITMTVVLLGFFGPVDPAELQLSVVFFSLVILVAALLITRKSSAGGSLSEILRGFAKNSWSDTPVILPLIILSILTLILAANYNPSNPDDLWYHLPLAASPFTEGTILRDTHPILRGYPRLGEYGISWIIACTHSLAAADMAQLPFVGLSIIACYNLCGSIGLGKAFSRKYCFLAGYPPIVFAQALTAHIDIIENALLLTATALIFQLDPASSRLPNQITAKQTATDLSVNPLIAHCGIAASLALLLGIKLSAVPQVAVLVTIYLLRQQRLKAKVNPLSICLSSAIVLSGAYQYLINLSLYRNPLYPFSFPLFDWIGPYTRDQIWVAQMAESESYFRLLLRSWFYPEGISQVSYGWFIGGAGSIGALLFLALVAALILSYVTRERHTFLLFLSGVLLFCVTPLNFSPRFSIFITGFGCVALAYLQRDRALPGIAQVILSGVIAFSCLHSFFQNLARLKHELPSLRTDWNDTCSEFEFPKGISEWNLSQLRDADTSLEAPLALFCSKHSRFGRVAVAEQITIR